MEGDEEEEDAEAARRTAAEEEARQGAVAAKRMGVAAPPAPRFPNNLKATPLPPAPGFRV